MGMTVNLDKFQTTVLNKCKSNNNLLLFPRKFKLYHKLTTRHNDR